MGPQGGAGRTVQGYEQVRRLGPNVPNRARTPAQARPHTGHTLPGSWNLVNSQGIAVVFISKSAHHSMTTKANIRVLGLAALTVVMAGFTVPTAFAHSDEASVSAPTITNNIFLCSQDDLGFGTNQYWDHPADEEPGLDPDEEAKMEAELAALDAAYESLFDRFYPETVLSEEEQAEFDAQLLVLDEEYDAVLAKISAALIGGEDADAEPLFETLVTIDAKYEQLYDRFYPKTVLSEEEQAEFDVRLGALDWVYDGILEKYGVEPEHFWDWDAGQVSGPGCHDEDADEHDEKEHAER